MVCPTVNYVCHVLCDVNWWTWLLRLGETSIYPSCHTRVSRLVWQTCYLAYLDTYGLHITTRARAHTRTRMHTPKCTRTRIIRIRHTAYGIRHTAYAWGILYMLQCVYICVYIYNVYIYIYIYIYTLLYALHYIISYHIISYYIMCHITSLNYTYMQSPAGGGSLWAALIADGAQSPKPLLSAPNK